MSKYIAIIFLAAYLLFNAGCHTVKSAAMTPANVAEGVATDAVYIYKGAEKVDQWLQEEYW